MSDDLIDVKSALEKAVAEDNTSDIMEYLQVLEKISMSLHMLATSNVARVVGKLRRHPGANIRALASSIVEKWKNVETAPVTTKAGLNEYLESTVPPELNHKSYDLSAPLSKDRFKLHHSGSASNGPVVYLTQRDLRISDNWALLHAQHLSITNKAPLIIVYCTTESLYMGSLRHSGYTLRCLKQMQATAASHYIPLLLLSLEKIITLCTNHHISTIITDFNPLREHRATLDALAASLPQVTIGVVDAHNIIPCWKLSDKCEFAAKTIRPKVHRLVETYLTPYLPVRSQQHFIEENIMQELLQESDDQWSDIVKSLNLNSSIAETSFPTTETEAYEALLDFLHHGIDNFSARRNDPTQDATSNLSPFLHFGLLSSQRILLTIQHMKSYKTPNALFGSSTTNNSTSKSSIYAFCEELVVRKELSDNFCYYNPHYDSISGAHAWAQGTISKHANDARPVVYSDTDLEAGNTKDDLWNAAQQQMVRDGKMHGFLRMYWAKKILEWTPSASHALQLAIYLNDKYSIDGTDPNGFVGCMWAIAGVHDRAWGPERPIFGTIRYMTYDGCKRKFDVSTYVSQQNDPSGYQDNNDIASSIKSTGKKRKRKC